MNKEVPHCPHCNAEIGLLWFDYEEYGKCHIDKDGDLSYKSKGGDGYRYSCPACGILLFADEDEAIKFLNK